MPIVVDDHLLVDVLAGRRPALVDSTDDEPVFTTGCWFYRLARAAGASGTGTLTRRIEELPESAQRAVRLRLDDLPPDVGLLSLRVLVPIMQSLRVRRPLNMLNAEALAAAVVLDAPLVVRVDSELLRSGAEDLAVDYRVV
jgi:hypothetical protein